MADVSGINGSFNFTNKFGDLNSKSSSVVSNVQTGKSVETQVFNFDEFLSPNKEEKIVNDTIKSAKEDINAAISNLSTIWSTQAAVINTNATSNNTSEVYGTFEYYQNLAQQNMEIQLEIDKNNINNFNDRVKYYQDLAQQNEEIKLENEKPKDGILADITTTFYSFWEGVGEYAENVFDTAATVFAKMQDLQWQNLALDNPEIFTDEVVAEGRQKLKADTQNLVGKEWVNDSFDVLYDKSGLKDAATNFDQSHWVGETAGKIFGNAAMASHVLHGTHISNMNYAVSSGISKAGQKNQEAFQNGATIDESFKSGIISGSFESLRWGVFGSLFVGKGAELLEKTGLKGGMSKLFSKMGINFSLSFLNPIVNSLSDVMYLDGYTDKDGKFH